VINPERAPDDVTRTPDGPQEIEDAAAQESEIPSDEGDEA